ncbi:MAG: GxxExxY protein [Spirochaetales bacterium]|nr:GxxExxY protein [Spirochaetales bacterium]
MGRFLLKMNCLWPGSTMEAQLINYLRLSGVPVGYLLNFRNTRVEWKRFVHQRE